MERNASEIHLFARLGFLIYADGYTSKIAGMKPGTDQNGRGVWDFTLDPSDELIKRFNLKVNSQGDMLYVQQIPYDLVICLNPDPAWTRWFYLRTYKGTPTEATQKLEGTQQQEEIMKLKQIIRNQMMKIDVTEEKLKMMELNMPKYLERSFKPMMEQILHLIEKLVKKS